MLVGAMNHPAENVIDEIKWMAEMDLDFVDLTLEPPEAAVWKVDANAIRKALADHGLDVIGHTAYYLPLASPFESLRRAAVEELKRCLEVFGKVGAKWMNLHPDGKAPLHDKNFHVERNLQTLRELLPVGRDCGVGLIIENLPGKWNTVLELSRLLEPLPEIGLHLDIGHANLMVEKNTTEELLSIYGPRLRHVHLHDNKGGSADLHLPLGSGTMEIPYHIRSLKKAKYDGTITLEVFCEDRHYLEYSRDLLRHWWEELAVPPPEKPKLAVTTTASGQYSTSNARSEE
ncbi:MAG: Xylose isomerase domain protein barrel [Verrucomicrobiales bacterium]|nr:Xylose isomerase domain protein barrel [Verrucomicrobiales bacterium]